MTDPYSRIHRRTVAALALLPALTLGITACGKDPSDQADTKAISSAPTSTPAALPTQDWNRLACQTLTHDMLALLDNLGDTRKAAENAAKSDDDVMRQHGRKLLDAVTARETADLNSDQNAAVDANLNISQAALDLAEACSTLYGDGNW